MLPNSVFRPLLPSPHNRGQRLPRKLRYSAAGFTPVIDKEEILVSLPQEGFILSRAGAVLKKDKKEKKKE